MLKRTLSTAAGVFLGTTLALVAVRWADHPGAWPGSERSQALSIVGEVLQEVHESHVDPAKVGYEALTQNALDGIVAGLDPHSEVLDRDAFHQLEEDLKSEFGGIGVQIEMRDQKVMVITPVAGSPGERAGLRRGDQIVGIDNHRLDNPTLDDVVGRLRGAPATEVRVSWRRSDEPQERSALVKREVIKTQSVTEVTVHEGGIGYIRLDQFTERTGEEFIAALNQLSDRKAVGLILDLRNNPGGLLDAAVEVAEPFFAKGELIVSTKGRRPSDDGEYRSASQDDPIEAPVVVLINENSASAAEIVAGALKDRDKAVIVGERSFGKGSVQSVIPLSGGRGMRLTTARYYTPSGVTLHEKGIAPQVEVVLSTDDDENIRLQHTRPDIVSPVEFKERFGVERVADRQRQVALELMQGLIALKAKEALGQAASHP